MTTPKTSIRVTRSAMRVIEKAAAEMPYMNIAKFIAWILHIPEDRAYPVEAQARLRPYKPGVIEQSRIVTNALNALLSANVDRADPPVRADKQIILKRVREMPTLIRKGYLYLSTAREAAGLICPCGCENEVFIPISSHGWSTRITRGAVTIDPEIVSRQCKTRFTIVDSQVRLLS